VGVVSGTHYTVMRDSQDGHLIAIPQLDKEALLPSCPEATCATLPHASASPESSATNFVPCESCMSTREVRGGDGLSVSGNNGRGDGRETEFSNVSTSVDLQVDGEGEKGGCGSAGIIWKKIDSVADSSEVSGTNAAGSGSGACKKDSEWVELEIRTMNIS